MSYLLTNHLLKVYGTFADKRIKNPANGSSFIADGRGPQDIASDGKPYGWFCEILVVVESNNAVKVFLSGDVPRTQKVDESFNGFDAVITDKRIRLTINRATLARLRDLASLVDAIVAKGSLYDTPSYKYSCPRTAYSLRKLADALDDFWKQEHVEMHGDTMPLAL